MTDERDRRPNWDEEPASAGKARDFLDPPREDPPDNVPIDPPDPTPEDE